LGGLHMVNKWFKLINLSLAIILSMLINDLWIDHLLEIFAIISSFSLIANRTAIALFIYFTVELTVIERNHSLNEIVNKLFFIYSIWLLGLLFGRVFTNSEYDLSKRFNFDSFLPIWIHHLDNPLVIYYILGNLMIYIPLGLFISYYFGILKSLLYPLVIITGFELLQAFTHLGYFDIDDVLLNYIGSVCGVVFVKIAQLKIK
jgi:glycopeptide antibiotics resistance protein